MITLLTLLAAIVPGLLICYFIVKLDKHEQEPLLLLLLSFGLGTAVFFSARYFEGLFDDWITPYIEAQDINPSTNIISLFLFAFVRTAFVEEFLKIVVLLLFLFNHKEFNEPMDGIVYAVMIGMGFAVVENVLYCFPHDIALALVRDFTAVPAHAVFGVILGYYVGLAKFRKKQYKYILFGFALTVGVHGLYDIFLFQEYEDWLMILATLVLIIGLVFSRRFINQHQKGSPFRPSIVVDTEKVLDAELALESSNQTNPKNHLQQEDNEILSAVLFEMKKNQEEEE